MQSPLFASVISKTPNPYVTLADRFAGPYSVCDIGAGRLGSGKLKLKGIGYSQLRFANSFPKQKNASKMLGSYLESGIPGTHDNPLLRGTVTIVCLAVLYTGCGSRSPLLDETVHVTCGRLVLTVKTLAPRANTKYCLPMFKNEPPNYKRA